MELRNRGQRGSEPPARWVPVHRSGRWQGPLAERAAAPARRLAVARLLVVALALLAAAGAAFGLMLRGEPELAQASDAAMGLQVFEDKAGQTIVCDVGEVHRKCEVEVGQVFDVRVLATTPPQAGYTAFQIVLQFGSGVNLVPQADLGESKFECVAGSETATVTTYQMDCKLIGFGDTTPPITNPGPLANVLFMCKGEGTTQVDLVGGAKAPFSAYTSPSIGGTTVLLKSVQKGDKAVADAVLVNCVERETPTPSATPTATRTATGTATRTATVTSTPTRTATATVTSTATTTGTATATATASATGTVTRTATATATLTATVTGTPNTTTPTSTATATRTPTTTGTPSTATPTSTLTPGTPTFTATPPDQTPTFTPTTVVNTATPTQTSPCDDPEAPATCTPRPTETVEVVTSTPVPDTPTNTPPPAATPTSTFFSGSAGSTDVPPAPGADLPDAGSGPAPGGPLFLIVLLLGTAGALLLWYGRVRLAAAPVLLQSARYGAPPALIPPPVFFPRRR